MDEAQLNMSIRRFLKEFGVSAQREIEQAVHRGLSDGSLKGVEAIPVRATLVLGGVGHEHRVEGTIRLS